MPKELTPENIEEAIKAIGNNADRLEQVGKHIDLIKKELASKSKTNTDKMAAAGFRVEHDTKRHQLTLFHHDIPLRTLHSTPDSNFAKLVTEGQENAREEFTRISDTLQQAGILAHTIHRHFNIHDGSDRMLNIRRYATSPEKLETYKKNPHTIPNEAALLANLGSSMQEAIKILTHARGLDNRFSEEQCDQFKRDAGFLGKHYSEMKAAGELLAIHNARDDIHMDLHRQGFSHRPGEARGKFMQALDEGNRDMGNSMMTRSATNAENDPAFAKRIKERKARSLPIIDKPPER